MRVEGQGCLNSPPNPSIWGRSVQAYCSPAPQPPDSSLDLPWPQPEAYSHPTCPATPNPATLGATSEPYLSPFSAAQH